MTKALLTRRNNTAERHDISSALPSRDETTMETRNKSWGAGLGVGRRVQVTTPGSVELVGLFGVIEGMGGALFPA